MKVWDQPRSKLAPPYSHPRDGVWNDHADVDWLAMGERDGVNIDERGRYVEAARPSLRRVERGVLETPCRVMVCLQFVGFPIWLLALEANRVSQLCIMGKATQDDFFRSMAEQGFNLDLIRAALANVGADKVTYSPADILPAEAVFLVSGPLSLVKNWSRKVPNPMLVLCDEHIRNKRTRYEPTLRWHRLRHETFGGVTQYQALIGSNVPGYEPGKTTLRRTIRHIINYGLKPTWAQPPVLGETVSTLSLDERLHPDHLTTKVLYHTHYSATGWGSRPLSVDEIGIGFGWPAWARQFTSELTPWFPSVPLQILDGCLKTLIKSVPRTTQLPTPAPAAVIPSSDRSWLPLIQKFLCHSWVDSSLVTAKAAKHDDAGVPVHLWDKRCALVFPKVTPALTTLRFWLTRAATTRMWREFRQYLVATHGADWRTDLQTHKEWVRGRFRASRKRARGDKGGQESSRYDDLVKDVIAGVDAITRFQDADWWAWKRGSSLFFWRWPAGEQRQAARDGMKIWVRARLPRYQRRAKAPAPEKKHLILEKLQKILDRGYVVVPDSIDFIKSLMDFFAVDKESDIRLVYNGTSCGLNDSLWAPNFWLPTPATAARTLGYGYFMVDIDLGEMFLNFPLHESLQKFSGVDFSNYATGLREPLATLGEEDWVHWTRCWMGLKPSPFMAIRFYYWAEEFARGNRREKLNPLRWDYVKLNLPGDPKYDPTMPRVMKWDSSIENIAGDIVAFVDDLRASGHSVERAWAIARQVVSRLQYLGLQDAPRKRRPPVRTPGAWAGSVFTTTDTEVRQSVSQGKWDRTKALLSELLHLLSTAVDGLLDYKRLEEIRGFLGHISMTYSIVTPYLKGLHLTLASHHAGRDSFGWKMPPKEWQAYLHESVENGRFSEAEAEQFAKASVEPKKPRMSEEGVYTPPEVREYRPLPPPPKTIAAVPRLQRDVEALASLFLQEVPAQVLLRARRVYTILYGFADASGSGFGSTILLNGEIKYRIGTWGSDSEDDSSNWREFENVVEALREEDEAGNLVDALIFLCTDNSTVESATVKGNSSSEKLFELTLEVRQIEMRNNAMVIISHVSGKRMEGQGTDGVSRGQLREGVSTGQDMLSFIPFHLSALQRSPSVEVWLKSWMGEDAEVLSPEGWFERGHDLLGGQYDKKGFWRHKIKTGKFVWAPPPAAALVAIEELRKARIKRQESLHVFVCPRLMKPEWFRQLYKASDIVFDVPVGCSCWPASMFEPLIIGVVFPFISAPPWQLRATPKMFKLGWQLRRVWVGEDVDAGHLLRKFLLEYERIRSMPPDVSRAEEEEERENDPLLQQRLRSAWGKKQRAQDDFLVGRDGDHLLIPFECDLCIFRKLHGRNPIPTNQVDLLLQACIRRANLDAFWSRARGTATSNRDKVAFGLKMSRAVGLLGPYEADGPLPEEDHCGYEVAIEMLLHSRQAGSYSAAYTQFDTIRKLRTAFSNHCRASAKANRVSMALGDQKGQYKRFSTDPCSSFWFYRFVEGARTRMGQDWRPNKALSIELLLALLESSELKIREAVSLRDKNRWIVFHAYVAVCYTCSLRGCEGFLLDLAGLNRKFDAGGEKYVVIALLGKIKGETDDRDHLLPCVPITSSGINVRETVSRLIEFKRSRGIIDGPAISDVAGDVLSHQALNDSLLEVLEELFDSHRELFPPSVPDKETLRRRVQVYRTLRRTSDTRALNQKVNAADIDVVNRWKSVERADGNRPHRPMRQHYAELELLLGPFLRYTWAM